MATFDGYVQNDTGQRLTLTDSGSVPLISGFKEPPPMTIAAGAEGHWQVEGNTDVSAYVVYAGSVNGKRVHVRMEGNVPWIGSNAFTHSEDPTGVLQVDQEGSPKGWAPRVIWTLTAA